jgi:hypothetical protein
MLFLNNSKHTIIRTFTQSNKNNANFFKKKLDTKDLIDIFSNVIDLLITILFRVEMSLEVPKFHQ